MTNSVCPQPQKPQDIRQRVEGGSVKSEKAISRPAEHPHVAPSSQPWSTLRLPAVGNGLAFVLFLLAIVGYGPYTGGMASYTSLTRLCLLFAALILTFTTHTYLAFFSRSLAAGKLSSFILVMISGPLSLYVLFTMFAEWGRLVTGVI